MTNGTLVDEIENFLRESGMEATIFGHRVNREWRLVDRLRSGGDVTTRTAEKIRTFIEQNRAPVPPRPKRSAPSHARSA